MATFVFVTFVLILIPVIPLVGTALLWGLLPFVLLAVWGLYFALQRNHRALQISETLTLDEVDALLVREDPGGTTREWRANRYWAQVRKYATEGPVPNYLTLIGANREVEIGAFLSEEERVMLFEELSEALSKPR